MISDKTIRYCECGCGQTVINRFVCGHHRRGVPSWNASLEIKVVQLCQCGCGQYTNPGKKYIYQHHCIGKPVYNKGIKMSEDQKQKLSKIHKDAFVSGKRKAWNAGMAGDPDYFLRGVKRSSESIRKMVETKLKRGNKLSEETKRLIGSYHKGKVISEEQKKAVSEKLKGKKFSEEHNRKISDFQRIRFRSKEELKKKSVSMKKKFEDAEYIKKYIAARNAKPNKLELFFDSLLQEMFPNEWKYVGDFQFFLGGKNPDFMNVNGKKQLIELFGDYYHEGENPQDRINHFRQYGFDTLVIWESELRKNVEKVKERLRCYASH